jgi:hypothetical protein
MLYIKDMNFFDYWIYMKVYGDLPQAYAEGFYYSPAFWAWFYPIKVLNNGEIYLGALYVGLLWLCILLWTQPIPKGLIPPIVIVCFTSIITANLDIWITVVIVAWEPYRKKHPGYSGIILGFLCFKPIVACLLLWYFPQQDRMPFLLGFCSLIVINYGYFLWNLPAFGAFLHAATMSNHGAGMAYLSPFHYGWFVYHYIVWLAHLRKTPFIYLGYFILLIATLSALTVLYIYIPLYYI